MIRYGILSSILTKAFLRNKLKFTGVIISLLATHFAFFFEASRLILSPSFKGFFVALSLIFLSHLANNSNFAIQECRRFRDLIIFLHSLRSKDHFLHFSPRYMRINASDLIRTHITNTEYDPADDIDKWLVQFGGAFKFKLEEVTNVFYVPGATIFATFTSGFIFDSYIFISKDYKNSNPYFKFQVLHEVMHCTSDLTGHSTSKLWLIQLLILSIALIANKELTLVGFSLLVLTFAFISLTRLLFSSQVNELENEVKSDYLAISFMTENEISEILSDPKMRPKPDLSLGKHNQRRIKYFEEFLRSKKISDDDLDLTYEKIQKKDFSNSKLKIMELTILVTIFGIATQTTPQEWSNLLLSFFGLALVVLMFVFSQILRLALKQTAESIISTTFPRKEETTT